MSCSDHVILRGIPESPSPPPRPSAAITRLPLFKVEHSAHEWGLCVFLRPSPPEPRGQENFNPLLPLRRNQASKLFLFRRHEKKHFLQVQVWTRLSDLKCITHSFTTISGTMKAAFLKNSSPFQITEHFYISSKITFGEKQLFVQ